MKLELLQDETLEEVTGGATTIEYGFIAALVAVALISSFKLPTTVK